MSGMTIEIYCVQPTNNATCNFITGSNNLETGKVEYSSYGYSLDWGPVITFLALFGLSTVLHFGSGIFSKHRWTLLTFGLGSLCETISWVGRLMSKLSNKWHPDSGGFWFTDPNGFLMQICCLIIAPAFLAAGCYILLSRTSLILSRRYLFIHPRSYAIVCILGDFISLIIQGAGGGYAATAVGLDDQNVGAYIMVGGVFWQLVIMVFYTVILIAYIIRYKQGRPFDHQIELFNWWPDFLRTRKHKKSLRDNTTAEDVYPLRKRERQPSGSPDPSEYGGREGKDLYANDTEGTYTAKEVAHAEKMLYVCAFATGLIFVRSIYRCCELINGWNGRLATDQNLFTALDGALMVTVCLVFNIMHPRFWIPRATEN